MGTEMISILYESTYERRTEPSKGKRGDVPENAIKIIE